LPPEESKNGVRLAVQERISDDSRRRKTIPFGDVFVALQNMLLNRPESFFPRTKKRLRID